MHRNNLPFEPLEAAELEEVKADLVQVLHSLGQKEVAADVLRGSVGDTFYKVSLPPSSCLSL